jgi:predicted PurR-regulated permease PerM
MQHAGPDQAPDDRSPRVDLSWTLSRTAAHALVATLVALTVVVGAIALWELKVVLALLLLGVTIASAMRPGIERLAQLGIPRSVGILIHYAALLGIVALFLSFVVPTLTDQVQSALHAAQTAHASSSDGLKAKVLNVLARRLHHLPSADRLVQPALSIGAEALRVLIGILFTFAVAAYWIFERERTVDLVASVVPRPRRKKLRDTWTLIDQKLGAFVRGELVLIAFVSALATIAFSLVGEPYWLLVGITTGILEIVPVVGPLAALALAVGAGLTASWHVAAIAGAALLAIRLFEDYFVTPRVLGGAVGLSPLLTLVSVSVTGILLGGFYVLLSVPIAALVATVIDVAIRGIDPSDVEVPTVLFSAQDT